jgi:hypothetical protein
MDFEMTKKKKFEQMTLELLKHKYRYYVLCAPTIGDDQYAFMEKEWHKLGLSLGLDMDNYQHWIDFDRKHPLAQKAIDAVEGA